MAKVFDRFAGMAADYDKYRAPYPAEAVRSMLESVPSVPGLLVDIGAGTGLFTAALVEATSERPIVAIEPAPEMLQVLAARFRREGRVHILSARAARTGLKSSSAALVATANAFHLFDSGGFFHEARRILSECGVCAIVRNTRPPQPIVTAFDDFFASSAGGGGGYGWRKEGGPAFSLAAHAAGFTEFGTIEHEWIRRIGRPALIAMELTRPVAAELTHRHGRAGMEVLLTDIYRSLLADDTVDVRYVTSAVLLKSDF